MQKNKKLSLSDNKTINVILEEKESFSNTDNIDDFCKINIL